MPVEIDIGSNIDERSSKTGDQDIDIGRSIDERAP
jgi:hypothetical protein